MMWRKFATQVLVGRTPSSAPDPRVRLRNKADEGVGRGPGGPPHNANFFSLRRWDLRCAVEDLFLEPAEIKKSGLRTQMRGEDR